MTPQAIEAIVADFRAWLQEAKEMPTVAEGPEFDVATVVEHFTALRHEVNLQTKASRAQLEQNTQALGALQQALDAVNSQPGEEDAQDELLRPLLKTLIDAHDALSLAQREVQRMLDKTPASTPMAPSARPFVKLRLPHWTRWFGLDVSIESQLAPLRAWHEMTPAPDDAAARFRTMLDALLVGYQMSLQRLERSLQQHGLEAICGVGGPFDPETMEVAEVVREPGRASTAVIDVLRPGYRWRGRLFRFAQVRVAKP